MLLSQCLPIQLQLLPHENQSRLGNGGYTHTHTHSPSLSGISKLGVIEALAVFWFCLWCLCTAAWWARSHLCECAPNAVTAMISVYEIRPSCLTLKLFMWDRASKWMFECVTVVYHVTMWEQRTFINTQNVTPFIIILINVIFLMELCLKVLYTVWIKPNLVYILSDVTFTYHPC